MSKILVTGGTGLVGAHLLYYLVNQGFKPIAIKRATSNTQNVKKIFSYYSNEGDKLFKKIEWRECDILDFIILESIVKEVQYIYHCAALISFNNKMQDKMIEVNNTGTSNIVDLALKYNITKIIYVSSIATLGSNNELEVDENCNWSWENNSGYAISKYLAEMEVWRGFAEGLPGIIVNPSLIIGPGIWNSGIGTIIKKSQNSGPFYPPGSCGIIHVQDLVEIMIKLMNSNITNERFIINADHINYKDLITVTRTTLNQKPPYIKLSNWIIKMFIFLDVIWCKMTGKKIELSTDAVKYTTNKIKLNSSKINSTIDFQYRDLSTSIKECVNLFRKEMLN